MGRYLEQRLRALEDRLLFASSKVVAAHFRKLDSMSDEQVNEEIILLKNPDYDLLKYLSDTEVEFLLREHERRSGRSAFEEIKEETTEQPLAEGQDADKVS
jgi:hypothetical protein